MSDVSNLLQIDTVISESSRLCRLARWHATPSGDALARDTLERPTHHRNLPTTARRTTLNGPTDLLLRLATRDCPETPAAFTVNVSVLKFRSDLQELPK